MKPSIEKLVPSLGESFRCFDRRSLRSPVKWHCHPEMELTYVQHGGGSRLVGDHIGSYGDHDLVLLGSNLPHTWMSDAYRGKKYDRHEAIVLQFHPEFLGSDFFSTNELAAIADLLSRAGRGLWFLPETGVEIGQRMTDLIDCQGAPRIIAFLEILHELTQNERPMTLASELFTIETNKDIESRIQQIADHVASNLSDPELGHAQLVEIADMNPSAFSRFFKESTGRTVSNYIAELRIGLACRLLSDTTDSILSISLQSGFSNLSNFNRRFRQLRGATPSEYRTQLRHARDD